MHASCSTFRTGGYVSFCSKRNGEAIVTDEAVMQIAQQRIALYDKSGEQHYDIISAFIKSMRGSDPNGAIYWLARMIEGGEDVAFIARRMVIFASEDIGNANPNALLLANASFEAVHKIGNPEARIILAQCATYLAATPKSNASYMAIEEALESRTKRRRPAGAAAHPQCAYRVDERHGLRKRVQVCTQL
jgi:replication-associated recombination protein RarA